MAYAIVTKYIGATNTKGARVKASTAADDVTIAYDDSLPNNEAHAKAAKELAKRLRWFGHWHQGMNGQGYCFVLACPRLGFTMEADV